MKEGMFIGGMVVTALGALIVVAALAGAVFGAIGGAIVGWFFDETSAKWLAAIGTDLQMWEIGAGLGFLGAFFKSSNTNNCKD